jgi:hypothetical protein
MPEYIGGELVIAMGRDEDLTSLDKTANLVEGVAHGMTGRRLHSAASRRRVSPGGTRVKVTGSVVTTIFSSASRATV